MIEPVELYKMYSKCVVHIILTDTNISGISESV